MNKRGNEISHIPSKNPGSSEKDELCVLKGQFFNSGFIRAIIKGT